MTICGSSPPGGLVTASPVPTGVGLRTPAARRPAGRATPLIRTPRTPPRVLGPVEAARLLAALRTHRDRAMVLAMPLGGLRRCEVLGLRLADFDLADRRVVITEGKGGRQRVVPMASGFFAALSDYLDGERADTGAATPVVFVALKGPRRGQPLSAPGLDEIPRGARDRAGIGQLTCHMPRHTRLTRPREAGMSLEAARAQAGHRNIASTRVYPRLADTWLSAQCHQAVCALDSSLAGAQTGGQK